MTRLHSESSHPAAHSLTTLRISPLDPPATPVTRIAQPIMQPIDPPLPEFDMPRLESKTTPEGRERYLTVTELELVLPRLLFQLGSVFERRTLL